MNHPALVSGHLPPARLIFYLGILCDIPARKFCSVKKLAGFLLRVSFSSEISVTKVLVFLVSFDSHSILDILFGTHGHSDGHPGPSKKTIPSIQVGIRRFMLRSSKVASI